MMSTLSCVKHFYSAKKTLVTTPDAGSEVSFLHDLSNVENAAIHVPFFAS